MVMLTESNSRERTSTCAYVKSCMITGVARMVLHYTLDHHN